MRKRVAIMPVPLILATLLSLPIPATIRAQGTDTAPGALLGVAGNPEGAPAEGRNNFV